MAVVDDDDDTAVVVGTITIDCKVFLLSINRPSGKRCNPVVAVVTDGTTVCTASVAVASLWDW